MGAIPKNHNKRELVVIPVRESILQEAERLTNVDRQHDYGHPLDDFTKIVDAAKALGIDPIRGGPRHHALYMVVVKLARETNKPKRDNLVDGAGYFNTTDMIDIEIAKRRGAVKLVQTILRK